MYNTRLKQWNIRKNYRAAEKELLAARIAQAHLENRSIDNLTFKDRPVRLDRVLRHCRAKKRESAVIKKKPMKSNRRVANAGEDEESSDSSLWIPVQDSSAQAYSASSGGQTTITPESGNTTTSVLTPSSSEPNEADDSYEIISHDDLAVEVWSPDRPLFPPKENFNLELILHQTQSYYLNCMDEINIRAAAVYNVTDNTTVFWANIKSAIYFLKKQSPKLAWPLLNEACVLAGDILSEAPVLFLNGLLTVLSPVNTRVCPMVRSTLLKYLGKMAGIKLKSKQHPLAILCRELSEDTECGNASEMALNLTLNMFSERLGRDHSATFAVNRSLISFLRRAKQYDAAKELSEDLIQVTEHALVSRSSVNIHQRKPTSISMTEVCIAMTELVHIYIDMKEYVLAQKLCSSVLQNYQAIQGVNFPDSRAAYAMEDMAELCVHLGDKEGAIFWLQEALWAPGMLRGPEEPATRHIEEKICELMPRTNSQDRVRMRHLEYCYCSESEAVEIADPELEETGAFAVNHVPL